MPKCPNCKKDLVMAGRVVYNVDEEAKHREGSATVVGRAECCNALLDVTAHVKITHDYAVHTGGQTEDDWGS